MSFWRRLFGFARVKAEAAIARNEDPLEILESAYRTQLAAFDEARRGVAEVLTAEKRLEIEARALIGTIARHAAAARAAVAAGDDDVARRDLEREAFTISQRERVLAQAAEIKAQRLSLDASVDRLRMQLEFFRTEKLALAARLAASRAATIAGETVAGLSSSAAAAARAVDRARDATYAAQARAEAVVEIAGMTRRTDPERAAESEIRLGDVKASP